MKDAETASAAKTAVVLGATGLVGKPFWDSCWQIAGMRASVACGRPLDREHPKLETDTWTSNSWASLGELPRGSCLRLPGHHYPKAGSRDAFSRVDHDYVVCRPASAGHGVAHFTWVSAMGADPHSPIFYNRVKVGGLMSPPWV